LFKFPNDIGNRWVKRLFKGLFDDAGIDATALVIDLFQRFERGGGKIG
jgi:hypothetical protein